MLSSAALLLHAVLWQVESAAPSKQKCPKEWTEIGGRCYWMSKSEYTFEACQSNVCGAAGGTLACIREADSLPLSWQFKLGYSDQVFAAWIGYTDAGHQGKFSWVNGCDNKWTHWVTGEPNDYCGGEDCVAVSGATGGWMDLSCRLRFPCLCEYPGKVSREYNLSVPAIRDDTCYSDCGGITKWCSAWPFLRLYDVDDDICHWETTEKDDGMRRGKGVSECAKRAAANSECGAYISYAVGRCRCNPATGTHKNCTHREENKAYDIFKITADGSHAQLEQPGQRCFYTTVIDEEFFLSIRPATTSTERFRLWLRVAAIWIASGLPCGIIMVFVLLRLCCGGSSENSDDADWSENGNGAPEEAAYGPLIETAGGVGTSEAVNRWLFRGAFGSIVYGLALLALGGALTAHLAGWSEDTTQNEGIEVMSSMIMAVAKGAVTRAAYMVHCRMTATARQVAGPWVIVLALAKAGGAVAAIGHVAIFTTLSDRNYESVCFSIYLFRWSLLAALPLQCLAGVALWRVKVRAEPYAGREASVGGWVTLLVLGNFGAGAAVWWAGYVGTVHEDDVVMAVFFVFGSLSQIVAGVALLLVNRKIKQYFRQKTMTQANEVEPTQLGVVT